MKTKPANNCCGHQREALRSGVSPPALPPLPLQGQTRISVHFRYVGNTALTIHGPVSGKSYRFAAPGAEMEVDGRDASGFNTVPVLERLRG
jgi:hypothetical protein